MYKLYKLLPEGLEGSCRQRIYLKPIILIHTKD